MKPSEELYILIKSLTKSEKRYFKMTNSHEKIYLKIFSILDRQDRYDEQELLHILELSQPHVYKNYLYKLILKSLRSFYSNNSSNTILYNQLQNFEILFSRGLFKQAEKVIDKAKTLAQSNQKRYLLAEVNILEEKLHYRAPNVKTDYTCMVDEDIYDSVSQQPMSKIQKLVYKITAIHRVSGLLLNPQIKLEIDEILLELDLIQPLPQIDFKIYAAWIQYMHALISGDHILSCKYAYMFVELSEEIETPREVPIMNYEMAYSQALGSMKLFEVHNHFLQHQRPPENFLIQLPAGHFAKDSIHILNLYLLYEMAMYAEGIAYFENLALERMNLHKETLVVFHHAATLMYLSLGDYKAALKHNLRLLNITGKGMKEDLYISHKTIQLLLHWELKNVDMIEPLLKNYNNTIKQFKYFAPIDKLVPKYLHLLIDASSSKERNELYQQWFTEYQVLSNQLLNKNNLKIYFNFPVWLQSKIMSSTYKEAIIQAQMDLLLKS